MYMYMKMNIVHVYVYMYMHMHMHMRRVYTYIYNYIYNHCYDDIIIIAAVSCGHAKGPIDLLIQNAGYFMESGSQGYRVSWVW